MTKLLRFLKNCDEIVISYTSVYLLVYHLREAKGFPPMAVQVNFAVSPECTALPGL